MTKEILGIKYYDANELVKIIGLSKNTILLYLKKGKIKGRKFGTKWFVTEEHLEEFLKGYDTKIK